MTMPSFVESKAYAAQETTFVSVSHNVFHVISSILTVERSLTMGEKKTWVSISISSENRDP